ncbi:hypothetical protein ATCCBAA256_13040 [Mycobacterium montefiorense]|nr:hypothetical protein ATCCBAA256_13040 [Mycobacterium montefiorense]
MWRRARPREHHADESHDSDESHDCDESYHADESYHPDESRAHYDYYEIASRGHQRIGVRKSRDRR